MSLRSHFCSDLSTSDIPHALANYPSECPVLYCSMQAVAPHWSYPAQPMFTKIHIKGHHSQTACHPSCPRHSTCLCLDTSEQSSHSHDSHSGALWWSAIHVQALSSIACFCHCPQPGPVLCLYDHQLYPHHMQTQPLASSVLSHSLPLQV